jgi:hypothetical protein
MRNLVKAKLMETAPSLAKQLQAKGSLDKYLDEMTSQATSEMVSTKMQIALKKGYNQADYLGRVGLLNSAQQAATEMVLAGLEFPQDGTSPQNLDGTIGLVRMT